MSKLIVAELAHALGFVPLAWVALRREREAAYWWLAVALGISGIADTVAHWTDPWFMGFVYSVLQVSLIGLVLLWRQEAMVFVTVLTGVGLLAAWWDANVTLLVTVAWASVVGMVWERQALGMLRTALVLYFGLGLIAWWVMVETPSMASWYAYQSTRLLGILCFCLAVTHPKPVLRAL